MGQTTTVSGTTVYRAEPDGPPAGALILIHEIWGLVPHIESIADRFAGEGYLVLAPDLLSDAGVTPEVGLELFDAMSNPDEAVRVAAQPRLRELFAAPTSPDFEEGAVDKMVTLVDALMDEPGIDGRIAVLGFCFGGHYSFALAARDRRVRAAVPFYGQGLDAEAIAGIACPILAFYGDQDERLITALPELEEAMSAAGKDFTAQVYSGTGHAFFNDTSPSAYSEEAAEDAWATANAFLRRELAGAS